MRTVRDKLGSVHAQKWKYLPSGLRERCLFPRLGERATQAAGTMSGGEQQMLGIARALMASPKLIIVDELSLGTHASELLSVQRPFQRFPAKPRLTPGIAVDSRSHSSE